VAPVALDVPASQPFDAPSTFSAIGGQITAVTVTRHGKPGSLRGAVDADGTAWSSAALPVEGASYDVGATVADAAGATHRLTGAFTVSRRTTGYTVKFDITPSTGWSVGVYAPLVIRFHSKVTDKAAVERALVVDCSKYLDRVISVDVEGRRVRVAVAAFAVSKKSIPPP
jgi:hypothetical protein